MRIVGLFSGIGGLELPFHERGIKADLLCDVWGASRSVLSARFPGVVFMRTSKSSPTSLKASTSLPLVFHVLISLKLAGLRGFRGRTPGSCLMFFDS